jgi:hypothetical protein
VGEEVKLVSLSLLIQVVWRGMCDKVKLVSLSLLIQVVWKGASEEVRLVSLGLQDNVVSERMEGVGEEKVLIVLCQIAKW